MKAKQLIDSLGLADTYSVSEDFTVKGISCNSREVSDNFIFVAIKGTRADGHRFIQEAIDKGAKAVIVQHRASGIGRQDKINLIKVDDARKALAKLVAEFYGHP